MNPWIEALRPRTLPVSVAGVLAGTACAIFYGSFDWRPALLCLMFALLAQVASNFANEYFDYLNGLDRKGREGFRRGVTEGDISPTAMRNATFLTLLAAAIPGCALICWGGWWLIIAGLVIGIFALAYSAGPYPLSHHGLGDLAVVTFFGIVPVGFTAWLMTGTRSILPMALTVGLGVGLLAANVLIVNNYRDMEDDRAVGKITTVVLLGRKVMAHLYLMSGIAGLMLMCAPAFWTSAWWILPLAVIPEVVHGHKALLRHRGAELNADLGRTARVLLFATLILLAESIGNYC
ncbi:MAG: 1,4-dihydroxy-2-naphthoate octaprenyltransferase [Muribaculaceae bacterium]|nr:1,4-dihydroxy-2-naphthoate octaprenyltransferase [Muribaculaceae bacterium]